VNRHYSSAQGRFTQVDPLRIGAASLENPQSLNLYSYVRNNPVNFADPTGLVTDCFIDGVESDCGMALGLLGAGAGVIGPEHTTRWNSRLNDGKGGWEHFAVDARGIGRWGYFEKQVLSLTIEGEKTTWEELHWRTTRAVGMITEWQGQIAFNNRGIIRNYRGHIIGEGPIEMQMLGPLDYIGAGEMKVGAALAGVLVTGSLRGLLKSATTGATARLTQQGLEHIVARHWATSGAQGAGKFAAGTGLRDLKSMINQTVSQGALRSNTNGRPGVIYELNFGRTIGTDIGGAAASNLRVVVGPNGTVVTAFPF
jgi:hypothetical protein